VRIAAAENETNSKVFRELELLDELSIPSVISYGKRPIRKRYLKASEGEMFRMCLGTTTNNRQSGRDEGRYFSPM
jgi:hypothetical protein